MYLMCHLLLVFACDAGVSNAAIAKQLDTDRKTIIKWSKNGFV